MTATAHRATAVGIEQPPPADRGPTTALTGLFKVEVSRWQAAEAPAGPHHT